MIPSLFRSLALSMFLSFATPILVVSAALATLFTLSYIPGIAFFGHIGVTQLIDFLSVFGNGYPTHGILIIGFTCGTVGGLFDLFNFHFYQSLRSN